MTGNGWDFSVQAREDGHRFGWKTYVDQLSQPTALREAVWLSVQHPLWQLRLVNSATGEVTHIGHDGQPITDDVMRRDTRTPEQIMADVLADRYEASLERGQS